MRAQALRSPFVSVGLGVALLLSLLAHLRTPDPLERPSAVLAVALERIGEGERPTLWLDFDGTAAGPEQVGQALPPGLVALDPPLAVDARWLSPRRMALVPRQPLPPFRTFQVRLSGALAAPDGRPLKAEAGLSFASGRFGLQQPPRTGVERDGGARIDLTFTGPPAGERPLQTLRLLGPDGRDLRVTWASAPALGGSAWRGRLADPAPGAGATLLIPAGLAPAGGGTPLPVEERHALTWSARLSVAGMDTQDLSGRTRLSLAFSHELVEQDLAGLIRVSPAPADLALSVEENEVWATGSFTPGSSVRLSVLRGLKAAGGLRLDSGVERTFRIPRPEPSLRIATAGTVLSSQARPEVEVTGVNLATVEVTLRRVYPNNLVPLALRWSEAEQAAAPGVTRRLPVDAAPDRPFRQRLDLETLLGERPRGIWWVRVCDPEHPWRDDARLLQISDLALVARLRPEGLVVWVTRLSTGEPAADVELSAISAANQLCASGTTDADGVCLFPGPLTHEPLVVMAALGRESAWVDLSTHALAHVARDVEGREPVSGIEAAVLPDRGVVRPGDTLHADVVLRTPSGEAPPEALPLVVRLLGPDGRERRRLERRAGPAGLVAVDLPFGLDAATGAYALEATAQDGSTRWGSASFRVEAVLPDRIEPRLELGEAPLAPGQTLAVPVSARLLTGDPAPGRLARLRVAAAPRPARSEQGFTWGDAEGAPAALERDVGEARLDAEGRARFELTLPTAGDPPHDLDLTLLLEVVDVSGRAAFTRLTRTLRAPAALGLRLPEAGGFQFPVRLEGPGPTRAEAVLERVTWRGGYVTRGGQVRWRSERLLEEVARVPVELVERAGTARFDDPGEGTYRLRVLASGVEPVAVTFSRWGERFYGARTDDGAPRLPLSLVRGGAPGDLALIAVEAPFAGAGLLTVEGPGVLEAERVDVAAGPQTFKVRVPDVQAPNVHATLTLVRGQRGSGPAGVRLLGAVSLPIPRPERALPLRLTAPEQTLPEEPLAVTLACDEPCDVRLHVVDEGLLRLTAHPAPDPVAEFAARRRLTTRVMDIYARLQEGARYAAEAGEPGGDSDGDPVLAARLDPTARRTLETLAWSSGVLHLNGEREVRVPLPPFEGRVRVVAVAAGRRATGAARADVVVRGPIGLTVHVPRAVAPGDEFLVPVEVRGEQVATEVALERLTLIERGPVLRVRAQENPGVAAVVVTARDAAGHVAVRRAAFSVRPAAPLSVRHDVHRLAAAGALDLTLPDGWLAGTRRAHLVVGGSGALELLPALERLLEYPHGCIEQTVSRAFPLLAWSDLARLAAPDGGAPADLLPAAIDRVLSMQTEDGGLSYWPGLRATYPWGTTYGAHFLVEARASGHAVPKEALAALLDHLEEALREDRAGAYAAYVLARAGRGVAPALEALAERAQEPEERAWLAAAFVLRGEPERARRLLEREDDLDRVETEQGGTLASPLRARATLLQALVAARPEDPRVPVLAEALRQAAREAARCTTQENAAALLALARYETLRARREGATRGRLLAGGRTLAFDADQAAVLDLLPEASPELRLTADGPVTLCVRTQGVPRAPEPAFASPGFQIERRYLGGENGLRQGDVVTVVLSGRVPAGTSNLLLTDLLPGGLEIEEARQTPGTFEPDRVEPRDDRVLFFRTAPLSGAFEVRYRARVVTAGRFALPSVSLEALYAPGEGARTQGGDALEIRR